MFVYKCILKYIHPVFNLPMFGVCYLNICNKTNNPIFPKTLSELEESACYSNDICLPNDKFNLDNDQKLIHHICDNDINSLEEYQKYIINNHNSIIYNLYDITNIVLKKD